MRGKKVEKSRNGKKSKHKKEKEIDGVGRIWDGDVFFRMQKA